MKLVYLPKVFSRNLLPANHKQRTCPLLLGEGNPGKKTETIVCAAWRRIKTVVQVQWGPCTPVATISNF
jgi:hypothetical protein